MPVGRTDSEVWWAGFRFKTGPAGSRTVCKRRLGGSKGRRNQEAARHGGIRALRFLQIRGEKMATGEITTAAGATQSAAAKPQNYSRPLAVVTTLFFMWGFL